MKFGAVIEGLKEGKKFARKGWNGKGMHIYLTPGKTNEDGSIELPHIDMYTVNSYGRRATLCGWLASQTDMLEEDWEEVE